MVNIFSFYVGDDPGLSNQKTPTILLLTPTQQFHSFGFSARDFYHDLDQNEARRWYYFDKFKMILHHNKVIRYKNIPHTYLSEIVLTYLI